MPDIRKPTPIERLLQCTPEQQQAFYAALSALYPPQRTLLSADEMHAALDSVLAVTPPLHGSESSH